MATKIVKLTDDQLATVKIRDITSVVKGKFTAEETETLKNTTDEAARRELVVSLYKKYIDEVIAEADQTKADEDAAKAAEEAAKAKAAEEAAKAAENSIPKETTADKKTVNVNCSFTVDIRGVAGYNGTMTMTCDRLLVLAFRNPNATIKFRTSSRAREFINIVKNVKTVKGLVSISEAVRAKVCERLAVVNGL